MENTILTPELIARLTKDGFYQLKEINGVIYGLYNFMFTIGLVVDICPTTDIWSDLYKHRYCYPKENLVDAVHALHLWDGKGDPLGPWIKQKGGDIDRRNPLSTEPYYGKE